MDQEKTNEILFKNDTPLVMSFFYTLIFLFLFSFGTLISYYIFFTSKLGRIYFIPIAFFIMLGLFVGLVINIKSLINKRNVKIDGNLIKIKYILPFKKKLELNFENCVGTFPYTIFDYLPTNGGLIQTKGIIFKFKDNFLLKLEERTTEAVVNSLNNFKELYQFLESQKIKNFNSNINDCINKPKTLRGIYSIIYPLNSKKLAKKAFLKGEYKFSYTIDY